MREENEKALARLEEEGDAQRIDFYEDADFIANALVGSMRGIFDADGKEVPYTHEIGVQVLSAPENADVKEWVVLQAQQYSLFYEDGRRGSLRACDRSPAENLGGSCRWAHDPHDQPHRKVRQPGE